MSRRLAWLVALASSVSLSAAQTPAGPPRPAATATADRASIDRAIAAVFPSLVRVTVVYQDQQAGREVKGELSGSGTIISTDGYIVTNHHVAGRPLTIMCTLSTKAEIPADLVGTDPLSDIAVIKLRPPAPRTFPAAHFGDSSRLTRGQPVLAMGSPLALSQSVTLGIVSNPEMILPETIGADLLDGEDVGTIVRWIGHDAAIYPGNSGGPLVDLSGNIVGVNEISLGLGGAIPSNLARTIVAALIRDGHVTRSWTGIELQPRIGRADATGALVAWVAGASPAATAGLAAGDLLLSVNGTPIDVTYAEGLPPVNQLLFSLPIGRPATFVVRRAGHDVSQSVVPIARAPVWSPPSEVRSWGLVVSNLTDRDARELGRQTTDGARVVSIRPNGPADQAKPSLRPGDILVRVNDHNVNAVADLEAATTAAMGATSRAKLLVAFDRDGDRELTVVESGDVPPDDPPREAKKAWLPVDVQVLSPPLADRLGLAGRTGVRVTRLLGQTPLQVGDVVLAVDGDPVRASAPNDDDIFPSTIRRYRTGATVTLSIVRNAVPMTLPVTLGESPSQPREMKRYDDPVFEFRARDLAEIDREDPIVAASPASVIVESVAARGWASLGHLNGGDLILAIDGLPVHGVADLETRLHALEVAKPSSIVFEIQRGIRTEFVELRPAWK